MAEDATIKKYPVSTSEVAKMLGIQGVSKDLPLGTFADSHSDLPIANLPIVTKPAVASGASSAHPDSASTNSASPQPTLVPSSKFTTIAKAVGPFAAVFLVGLFLYYYFFSAVNFSPILNLATSAPKVSAPQVTAIQQLETQDSASYQQWVKGFYYDVTDTALLDPDADNSGNGLTNFQKYLLNLNPKSYDTLGLGISDSQALSNKINPLTGGPITAAQTNILNKYVDMEAVMNRLALYNLQNPGQVAGLEVNANGATSQPASVPATGLNIRGPQATNTTPSQPIYAVNPLNDSNISINTSIPGSLQIPDLKIDVPIIWSGSPDDFETDLQSGVVHYPGTAMPGQIGTTYIAGHSSNYAWAKGSYNKIFSTLGNLSNDASFTITVTQTNGKTAQLNYVVTSKQQYSPTDQAQFANTGKSVVALSTCWPVGSTAKRLVVFAQLTQVQQ